MPLRRWLTNADPAERSAVARFARICWSATRVDPLALHRISTYFMPLGERLVFERQLSRVTPATIREMAWPSRDPLPRCLDHDGFNDSSPTRAL